MGINEIIGVISLIFVLAQYIPYSIAVFKRKTSTPHPVTWLTLACSAGYCSIIMWQNGAGYAIVAGIGQVISGIIFGIYGIRCLKQLIKAGKLKFDYLDAGTIIYNVIIIVFMLFHILEPTIGMYLLCIGGVIAFAPTVRKVYRMPLSENNLCYLSAAIGKVLSLFTADAFTMEALFPAVVWTVIESGFVIYLLILRRNRHISRLWG